METKRFYVLINFEVYEDHFEKGEGQKTTEFMYDDMFKEETALDAIKKAMQHNGYSFDVTKAGTDDAGAGCIQYSNLVDCEYAEATDHEIEMWKVGDRDLYACNSTIYVFNLIPTEIKID